MRKPIRVKAYYLSVAPELRKEYKQIVELRKRMPAQPTTLVLEHRTDATQSRINTSAVTLPGPAQRFPPISLVFCRRFRRMRRATA